MSNPLCDYFLNMFFNYTGKYNIKLGHINNSFIHVITDFDCNNLYDINIIEITFNSDNFENYDKILLNKDYHNSGEVFIKTYKNNYGFTGLFGLFDLLGFNNWQPKILNSALNIKNDLILNKYPSFIYLKNGCVNVFIYHLNGEVIQVDDIIKITFANLI